MGAGLNQIKCLIVDDDEDDQEIFATALRETDLKNAYCIFADDAVEALEKLNNNFQPDYIFLDLNMPRIGGMECLSEIRKLDHLQQVPIAIYSTSSDENSKAQAYRLGATAFISKPTRIDDLVRKLNDFFTAFKLVQGT